MKTVIKCVLLVLFFGVPVIASTVADYKSRVSRAREGLQTMASIVESEATGRDYEDYLNRTEAEIRKSIPTSERIDLGPNTIETSNGWLHASLDQFHTAKSAPERAAILRTAAARVSGIEENINTLEGASASTRSKDEDKRKLAEILSREEYQKVVEGDKSAFQRFMEWLAEWLSDIFPRSNMPSVDPNGLQPISVILQFIVYALVIGGIGFLIYKFAPAVVERFRRREREASESRVILGEEIDDLTTASDLFAQAEQLARQGDLRAAIRKGYIALLCDLADRKVIGLARNKTNRDYLRDVRQRSSLFDRMKRATGSFERYWYGLKPPSESDWDEFTEHYRAAVSEVRQ
jgi:hypothetical protein